MALGPDAPFGADARAVDQDQRAAARQAADGGHRRLSFRDLVDAGDVLERLHQIGRLAHGDIAAAELVVPAAGVASMLGAEPETVTDSLTSGVTVTTSSGSAPSLVDHDRPRVDAGRIDHAESRTAAGDRAATRIGPRRR